MVINKQDLPLLKILQNQIFLLGQPYYYPSYIWYMNTFVKTKKSQTHKIQIFKNPSFFLLNLYAHTLNFQKKTHYITICKKNCLKITAHTYTLTHFLFWFFIKSTLFQKFSIQRCMRFILNKLFQFCTHNQFNICFSLNLLNKTEI